MPETRGLVGLNAQCDSPPRPESQSGPPGPIMASHKKNKKISDFAGQGSRSNAKPSGEGGTGLASGEGSSGVGGGGSNPTPGGNPGGILAAVTRHANGKFTM